MPTATGEKLRDAERSREALLAAAEELFAARGYEETTLHDIGSAAGLSRGSPTYFFGSKEQLYREVLERAFDARQRATAAAFAPVHAWCESGADVAALRGALAEAADGYIAFLVRRPTFVRLVMREELASAPWLRTRSPATTAMQDAFAAVRGAGRRRGVRAFRVEDAVLLFVVLTFAPLSYRGTLMRAVGRDLSKPAGRKRQVELAVDQMMTLVAD